MQMLHLPAAFLIMVVFSSQLTSLATVSVIYSREPLTKTEGLSLSLKCTVEFKTKDCDIEAKWWYTNSSKLFPLVDPNSYLITVNETERAEHRLRNIFLTISSLKLQDSGFYQCDATCLNSGTQAKGHFVHLNVTAEPNKGLKFSAWSGHLKTDATALALSAILLLLWCY
ncbi:mast/stem cell growth factor receptor kita [Labeo rohita]|uniref:mast/stem cell growth factor receptor kita n=1 Tax=Labeo rohita TaxID=84645 RepID=UPI0021E2F14E|nr:mast/stem cell growth factor receptor kita [Labeo rohita]